MVDPSAVITSNPLLPWVEKAGAKPHRAGHEWRCACPLHNGDNNSGFAVYSEDGKDKWTCFTGSCGTGDVIDFIMRWQGVDFGEAIRILGGERIDPISAAKAAAERAKRAEADLEAQITRAQNALADLRSARAWLEYHAHLEDNETARDEWNKRGVPDEWQDIWQLGYCPSFPISTETGRWLTPSITIPIFEPGGEVVNIRHRLLNPPKPNDKYRPDRPGLQSAPYLTDSELGYSGDQILVVEGEIKSMVTYITLDNPGLQVIGIPGKTQFKAIAEKLKGHDVIVCLDPDAGKEAEDAARAVGGRLLQIPYKIDDAILAGKITRRMLALYLVNARRVK